MLNVRWSTTGVALIKRSFAHRARAGWAFAVVVMVAMLVVVWMAVMLAVVVMVMMVM